MNLEYQSALLKDINKDMIEANDNLKIASNEVEKQGNQINNTLEKLEEAHEEIKTSDQTMNSIIRRKKIYKLFLYFVIGLELLAIVITLIVKMFGKK